MVNRFLHKIMLVEDDVDIQQIVDISLSAISGYEIMLCDSGYEAIEKAKSFSPDIILLDVMMPGMDGPSTLKKLRENPDTAEIPVIFLTAKIMPQEIQEYKNMGAVDVISKPFNPLTLSERIQKNWELLHASENSSKTINPKIALLAEKYGARLPEKWEEINHHWAGIETVPAEFNSRHPELTMLTHKLAGSAATYGYFEVSLAAKAIEKYLDGLPMEQPELTAKEISHLKALLEQLHKAIQERKSSPAP